jgi:cation diffusion facilitator CzcD-associated flavoprotein CzcO
MTTQGFLRLLFSWLLFLGMALPSVATGQTAPAAERQKIESLIKQVGELKDAKFIRNGSTHDVLAAVRFLRGKWQANDADVKTAKDFIDKVASASGTSGKPYLIRFKDGRQTKSRDFLLAELKKLES